MSFSKIIPAVVAEDRESAGINPATCPHKWAYQPFAGHDFWCQRCLIPGKVDTAGIEVDKQNRLEQAAIILGEAFEKIAKLGVRAIRDASHCGPHFIFPETLRLEVYKDE